MGREARVDEAVERGPRLVRSAVREVVRRRHAQRVGQLPRPPRRGRSGRADRVLLGRRGRESPRGQLRRSAGRDAAVRERAARTRSRQGRRGRDLHADASGDGRRDACVRADRRDSQRRLRWLLGRVGEGADGVLGRKGARHGRRDAAARRAGADEAVGRRDPRRAAEDGARGGRRPLQHRPTDDRGAGRVLARRGRGRRPRMPARADGRRGPPLRPLHVGLDREAEGDPAHHRRLPDPGDRDPQARVRHQGRRRVLVRGRHRLGDRPQLHRLRRRSPTAPRA